MTANHDDENDAMEAAAMIIAAVIGLPLGVLLWAAVIITVKIVVAG